jgi:hypothetical protein
MASRERMMTDLRKLAGLVLGMTCAVLAAGADAPRLPASFDEVYPQLVEQSAKLIEDSLAGEPTRRATEKARVAALMLAEFSQQSPGGTITAKQATLRDAALEIASKIKDKKYADAVAQAKRLPTLAVNRAAKTERVKLLGEHLEIDELMGQFRGPKVGGLGIETLLDKLAGSKDGAIPPGQLNADLKLIAFRTAVAAGLTREHMPKADGKEWLSYADDMRTQSLELAKAVQANNGKAAFTAVDKLNTSCNKCHLKFR